ncbi:MAG: Lin0368 family putative glycerol transporter subunit [Bacillota bacterium]
MTAGLAIATFVGAFIFPFLISMCWGKMVEVWGAIGGWMAAGFIVGTAWTLNHGVGLIYQSGGAWIDMAWAAGFGLLAGAVYSGASLSKAMPTIISSIIGGTIGAFVLAQIL